MGTVSRKELSGGCVVSRVRLAAQELLLDVITNDAAEEALAADATKVNASMLVGGLVTSFTPSAIPWSSISTGGEAFIL